MKFSLWILALSCTFFQCSHQTFTQGEQLFNVHCSGCHGLDGNGLGSLYPPLTAVGQLQRNQEVFGCLVRYGRNDSIVINGVRFDEPMLGIIELSSIEIANIHNYIVDTWHPETSKITEDQIHKQLEHCTK